MLVTLLLACLLVAVGGSSWPTVDPGFKEILKGDSHTAVCRFGGALADCRLHVWEPGSIDKTLDFRRGAGSAIQKVTKTGGGVAATASYAGTGLGSGECGVRLAGVLVGDYLVQCAGKLAANGSWATGLTLLSSKYTHLFASSSPTARLILAAAGSDVNVQLNAGRGELDSCYIQTPAAGWQDVGPGRSLPPGSRYHFHEAGRKLGLCNWTLNNLQPEDDGLWWWAGRRGDSTSFQFTVVAVVAAPRGGPEVRVRDAGTLGAGDVFEASCSAPAAVPPSELTWLLDGQTLRRDTANDTLEGDEATWTLPWEPRPARQTLRHLLTSADLGKTLECRAQHVAEVGARLHSVVLGVATTGEPDAVAECGLRHPSGTQLSVGGMEAETSEFPWHVAVFRAGTNLALCGGSLISPKFLISAAHCFKSKNLAIYNIAAGKNSPDWDIEEANEQRRSVKKINIPGSFDGHFKKLESDVAVVELAEAMYMTPEVGVVCSDWTLTLRHRHFAVAGSVGIVPGWGLTENNTQSSTLRFVELPFVATNKCRQSVPKNFRPYLTVDKFCGGYFNRSINVCEGDFGGGYIFANSKAGGRYFLRGVASVSPHRKETSCQIHFPTAFISISAHGEWIRGIVFGAETSDDY